MMNLTSQDNGSSQRIVKYYAVPPMEEQLYMVDFLSIMYDYPRSSGVVS